MIRISISLLLCLVVLIGAGSLEVAAEEPRPASADGHQHRIIGDWEVVLDARAQVLRVDLPRDVDWDWNPGEEGRHGRTIEPPLTPTPPLGKFASIGVLGVKAKVFDDGLMAAVELAAQNGVPGRPGKREALRLVRASLAAEGASAAGNGPAVVFAASALGGDADDVPASLQGAVSKRLVDFRASPWASSPLGFYTWTPELVRVFQQDRMLQTPLEGAAGTEALVQALRGSDDARRIYERSLVLAERLTNPFAYPSLRDVLAGRVDATAKDLCWLPPSMSHESELAKALWGNQSVPDGASLVDELISRVRSGKISLAPTEASGWYDHQAWALAPLLQPEKTPAAERVRYGDAYRAYLEETFKALLGLTRETHVKQVESPTVGAPPPPPLEIGPKLTLEPLPTHYERKAASYAFVRGVLQEHFGDAALTAMRRLTPAGATEVDLARELAFMEALFRGAAETARYETGMPAGEGAAGEERELFRRWAAKAVEDPDVGRDVRMMVPVFHDIERKETKVWVFLGWLQRPFRARYENPPRVVSARHKGKRVADPEAAWEEAWHTVAYPVVAEVYVKEPMNRGDFRRHCDRFKTRSAILANLR